MRKLTLAIIVLLIASMLLSCDGETSDTTKSPEITDAPETDAPETDAPETNAPETDEPETDTPETDAPVVVDEHSELAGVASMWDGSGIIKFADGRSLSFDATAANAAFEKAAADGFEGDLTAWLSLSVIDAANKLYKDTDIGANAFGGALATMLENYNSYFSAGGAMKAYETEITPSVGYFDTNGNPHPNSETQTYRYTQRIKVSSGQTFELFEGTKNLPMRFVTAYKDGVAVSSLSMIDPSCTTTKFVIPSGVTEVVATFRAVEGTAIAKVSGMGEIKPALRNKVDSDTLTELMGGTPEIIIPDLVASTDSLKDNVITLGNNHVMHNKLFKVTFNVSKLEDGQIIRLGHGEKDYGGSAVEITKNNVVAYYYTNERTDRLSATHGLDISGDIEVTVKVGFGMATVSIENADDKYVSGEFMWGGRNGKIFVRSEGVELTKVDAEWSCSDYDKDIWLLGDSYFNTAANDRWPYYLYGAGYTDYFMSGFPGRNAQSGIIDFKDALNYGTPKYAVWCLGMNNNDSDTAISATWKPATDEFIAICEEYGIIPILTTTPNTPKVKNSLKNDYVKSLGYRYIDFAAAVNGEELGSSWTRGMISGDNVHPSPSGAKALYEQVIKDFPEIMGNK
ncbi:MAG: SGNH/GDSL hydrolase family protein [Clostridia bacterium]|nr:SGNH/GDSL hydrolase family protein [Clostridia bacterium]